MGTTLPSRIYLSPPDIGLAEREFVRDAFDSNWIAPQGPHVDAFERELADFVKVPHAAALSSGTATLHLALLCHGVGRGFRGCPMRGGDVAADLFNRGLCLPSGSSLSATDQDRVLETIQSALTASAANPRENE